MIAQRTQVTVFFIQELILGAIYLFQTWRLLKSSQIFGQERARQVLKRLIYANTFIIFLDIGLLCVAHTGTLIPGVWAPYKGFAYSVKLKIEFVILNQLKEIAGG